MLKKRTKFVCVIIAVLLVFLTVAATAVYFFNNQYSKNNFSLLSASLGKENFVLLNSNVKVINNSAEIQSNLTSVKHNKSKYTLTYRGVLPDFFNRIKKKDIFYVCPDKNSDESRFALGFCGKITSVTHKEKISSVSFVIPALSEVFSEIKISSDTIDTNVSSASFIPGNGLNVANADSSHYSLHIGRNDINMADINTSMEKGDNTYSLNYKKADKKSNLKDYLLLGKSLTLKVENGDLSENIAKSSVSGSITLDYPALKFCIDYKKDKNNLKLNKFDLGFITKQKIDLKIKSGQSIGLNDLTKNQENHILDLIDVTKSERKKGKIVLGTYLVGIEANIPHLENKGNKVNSFSFGIAIQLTLTAKGELNLEYNINEAGFLRAEINSDGEKLCENKSYDYPNPVINDTISSPNLTNRKPKITSSIKGQANLNLAVGSDIGFCIMGMVPMKFTNDLVNIDMSRTFDINPTEDEVSESRSLEESNFLLDDNLNSYVVSSNTYFKLKLGTKINLGIFKDNYSAGGSILLRDNILYQYPNPVGFSHKECNFGGVLLGKAYSDNELSDTVTRFLKNTGKHNIITDLKQSAIGSIVNGAISSFKSQLVGLSKNFNKDIDNCKVDYFTSGVIYIRNEENIVISEIVIGSDILNKSGFHTGLSSRKTRQIYSAPDTNLTVELEIGTIAKLIFGLNDIDNTNITRNIYKSKDSEDVMEVLTDNNSDSVKLIILS